MQHLPSFPSLLFILAGMAAAQAPCPVLVKDINQGLNPGPVGASLDHFTQALGNVFFSARADSGTQPAGPYGAYACNGRTLTKLPSPSNTSSASYSFAYPTAVDDTCFYVARSSGTYELWMSNGTVGGTKKVVGAPTGIGTSIFRYNRTPLGSRVIWTPWVGSSYQLWAADSVTGKAERLSTTISSTFTAGLFWGRTRAAGKILFYARFGSTFQLWMTDGTAAGTMRVPGSTSYLNIAPPVYSNGVALGTRVVYLCQPPTSTAYELWAFDGNAAGKIPLPGNTNISSMGRQTVLGDKVVFVTKIGSNYELWVTDGTGAGTKKIPGSVSSTKSTLDVFDFPQVSGVLAYYVCKAGSQYQLWVTDGIKAARVVGSPASNYRTYVIIPGYGVTAGKNLFFISYTGTSPNPLELWVADGVSAKKVTGAPPSSHFNEFLHVPTLSGVKILFLARGSQTPWRIYLADETKAALIPNQPTANSNPSWVMRQAHAINGTAIYQGYTATHGFELWFARDLTGTGSGLLADLNPGPGNFSLWTSSTTYTRDLGNRLYFLGNDSSSGYEIYRTDGTPQGTKRVCDLNPGIGNGVNPTRDNLFLINGSLVLQGDNGAVGPYEIFRYDPGAARRTIGTGCGIGPVLSSNAPALGANWNVAIDPRTALAGVLMVGSDIRQPLRIHDLTVWVNPVGSQTFLMPSNWALSLPIPADPSLVGIGMTAEGFVTPGIGSPLGVDHTNALRIHCGR